MATKLSMDKLSLLDDFIRATASALQKLEETFELNGLIQQYFELAEASDVYDADYRVREPVRDRVRSSIAWRSLTRLYDYALDGVLSEAYVPLDLVIEGQEVLSLIDLENSGPSDEWRKVVDLGAARFALDTEQNLPPESVALLAAVDIRTVRNAISAGELKASKREGLRWIENASARTWLSGRRGFKPTALTAAGTASPTGLDTPVTVGAFLRSRRESLGKSPADEALIGAHPAFDKRTLENIERGIFLLPLSAVFPLADFYELDRTELLETVMRVFFNEELATLHDLIREKTGDQK